MIGFALAAATMIAAVIAVVALPMLRKQKPGDAATHAALNAQVYRWQLAEDPQSRDEVLRRALAEAGDGAPTRSAAPAKLAALVVALAIPALAVPVYLAIGDPAALATGSLEAHLKHVPSDARGWIVLARSQADAGRFGEAARAYERALAASAKVARDPQVWCELADALGMAQRSLRGRPQALIEHALALEPRHPVALEMAGSAQYEQGNYRAALAHWEALFALLTHDPERRAELAAAIERTRRLAGI